ncbi:MAG TPA: DUF222 domain-containing protein [Kofleriaceae bacterium]|nr:DUF222 domain-containing protein [Kofleriaceae bacterium]
MDGELEQLGERIAEQAAHLDAAMHRLLTDLRDFDARGGWHVQGAASCAHWLAWRVGWDLVTARDHVRVARKLADCSLIDGALRRGELSYSKVRALLRVATPANEELFLDHARLLTASQLEKLCRKYALVQRHGQDSHPQVDEQRRHVRRRDLEDGMVKIEAVLHPEEAELVWTMLNHAASRLAREAAAAAGAAMAGTSAAAGAAGSAELTGSPRLEDRGAHEFAGSSGLARRGGDSAESSRLEGRGAHEFTGSSGLARRAGDCAASSGLEGRGANEFVGSSGLERGGGDRAESLHLESRGSDEFVESPGPESWGGDSAESRGGEVPVRSLLDRLLDDAEALRGLEAVADESAARVRERSASPSSGRETEPRGGQFAARDAGVLRDRAAAARKAFNRADALVELAQGYLRGDRPNRSPIEVTLTIPASVLRDGNADPVEVGEIGESFVSGEAARRLSCDAGVVEVLEDEHGAPLSVGRKRRTIAGALRRALHQRDHACTYPGCTNRLFLEGHHIKHWADGGETSLRNTALLCSLHHRHVHELGYTVDLGPDQRPRFRDPRGRLVAVVPEQAAPADLGWPRIRAVNESLAIDAHTISGPWDGTPVDYPRIVGHLVAVEGLA